MTLSKADGKQKSNNIKAMSQLISKFGCHRLVISLLIALFRTSLECGTMVLGLQKQHRVRNNICMSTINFKISTLMYQSLNRLAPTYLAAVLISFGPARRQLQSATPGQLYIQEPGQRLLNTGHSRSQSV